MKIHLKNKKIHPKNKKICHFLQKNFVIFYKKKFDENFLGKLDHFLVKFCKKINKKTEDLMYFYQKISVLTKKLLVKKIIFE